MSRQTAGTVLVGARVVAAAGFVAVGGAALVPDTDPEALAERVQVGGRSISENPDPVEPDDTGFVLDAEALEETLTLLAPRIDTEEPETVAPGTVAADASSAQAARTGGPSSELSWRYLGRIRVGPVSIALIATAETAPQQSLRVGDVVADDDFGDVEVLEIAARSIRVRHDRGEAVVGLSQPRRGASVSSASLVRKPQAPASGAAAPQARVVAEALAQQQADGIRGVTNADDPVEVRRKRLAELREQRRQQREQATRDRASDN
ncbi:MAG: hypothetical protein AAF108_10860 [Planctomycetota bacterium]